MADANELQAAAEEIADAIRVRLDVAGWVGEVVVYPAPAYTNAITVEVTPDGFPAPGVESGQVMVPYEAWTDAAAQSSIVEHLTSRWMPTTTAR